MPKRQMTLAEFNAALREAGFSVDYGRIVDVSGRCFGFAAMARFNHGVVNREATISNVLWEREAEIAQRVAATVRPVAAGEAKRGQPSVPLAAGTSLRLDTR
jgi:hypothetical protein